jgi:hypothetical protein
VFVDATGTGMVVSNLTGPLFSGELTVFFLSPSAQAPVPTNNRAEAKIARPKFLRGKARKALCA